MSQISLRQTLHLLGEVKKKKKKSHFWLWESRAYGLGEEAIFGVGISPSFGVPLVQVK